MREANQLLGKLQNEHRDMGRQRSTIERETREKVEKQFESGCAEYAKIADAVKPFSFVEDSTDATATFVEGEDGTYRVRVIDTIKFYNKQEHSSHAYSRKQWQPAPEGYNELVIKQRNNEDQQEAVRRTIIECQKELGNIPAVERATKAQMADAKLRNMGEEGKTILEQLENFDIGGLMETPSLPQLPGS